MKKVKGKIGSLRRKTRDYLANKSRREIARLLGHRARQVLPARKRGRRLKVFNPWQKWEIDLVGVISDAAVAKKTGRHEGAVRSFRRNHDISRFIGRLRFWTEAEDKLLLQTGSRKEAARLLNRPLHSIEYRHKQLKSGARLDEPPRPWTKGEIALLGKHSDTAICRKLGRSFSSVRTKRKELKIHCHGNPGRSWTARDQRLLGTMPDAELARKIGRTYHGVFVKRSKLGISRFPKCAPWSSREETLMGTMPDAVLALKIGRSEGVVFNRRRHLGIASFRKARPKNPGRC